MKKITWFLCLIAPLFAAATVGAQTPTIPPGPCCLQVEVDALLNDSDKTTTIPVTERWEVRHIFVELITTATVGSRQLRLVISDKNGGELFAVDLDATIAASLTETRTVSVFPGSSTNTVIRPSLPCPVGGSIRIFDSAAIDAAADDMTVRILADKRTHPLQTTP